MQVVMLAKWRIFESSSLRLDSETSQPWHPGSQGRSSNSQLASTWITDTCIQCWRNTSCASDMSFLVHFLYLAGKGHSLMPHPVTIFTCNRKHLRNLDRYPPLLSMSSPLQQFNFYSNPLHLVLFHDKHHHALQSGLSHRTPGSSQHLGPWIHTPALSHASCGFHGHLRVRHSMYIAIVD